MNSGQGDGCPAKADEDTEVNSSGNAGKTTSKDQVDHALESSVYKEPVLVQVVIADDNSNKTDSGFKDNLPSDAIDKTKSNSGSMDDNSDDDLELKWEDDEADDQDIVTPKNFQESTEPVSKPINPEVEDTNLSTADAYDDKTEEIDENKLLESSPSNNEDTNVSSTSGSAKSNLPLSKIDDRVEIPDDIEVVDENQLLEGPESDAIDEEKLLESRDGNKTEEDVDDLNSTGLSILTEKPTTMSSTPKVSSTITKSDKISLNTVPKESQSTKELTPKVLSDNKDSMKASNSEDMPIRANLQKTVSSNSPNDSLMDTSVILNTEHGLNRPDMMLEIPTQEIIELMDDTDFSISGSFNKDDDEVDSDNDFSKTDTTMDIDGDELGRKADEIILQPANVFRALDSKNTNKNDKEGKTNEKVSEDDWCEIERRLEGFENSFKETSEDNKVSKAENIEIAESATDASPESNDKNQTKTESLALTEEQQMVIETENKALLNTLQDTSRRESIDDRVSSTIDAKKSVPGVENLKLPLTVSPLPSKPIGDKGNTTEENVRSDVNKRKETISTVSDKEVKTCNVNHLIKSDKTDSCDYDLKSISTENLEPQMKSTTKQLESAKLCNDISTTDLSKLIDDQITVVSDTVKVDDLTKKTSTNSPEQIKVEDSSKKTSVKVLSDSDKSIQLTLSKPDVESITHKPIDQDSSLTAKPSDKIVSADKEKDKQSSSNSPNEEKVLQPISDEVSLSVDDKKVSQIENAMDVESFTDIEVQVTTPKVDIEPTKDKSNENVQQTPLIEVDPSTEGVPSTPDITSTSKRDDQVSPLSQADVQSSTSTNKAGPWTSKIDNIQPSTSKIDDTQPSTSKVDDIQPSTSKIDDTQPSTSKVDDIQPSTSTAPIPSQPATDPDSADDTPEVSDSLGLLAESSRVMEDDEEQDDDDDGDADGDDDDDYYPEDESSNQMTADHSEDSNAPHSETDHTKEKEMDTETPTEEKGEDEFNFASEAVDKDGGMEEDKDGGMEVDDEVMQDDIEVSKEQVGGVETTDDIQATEATGEPKEDDKDKQADAETVKQSDTPANKTDNESMLRGLLLNNDVKDTTEAMSSPSKKADDAKSANVTNIVDLDSEDDIQEEKKDTNNDSGTLIELEGCNMTIPSSVNVTSVACGKTDGASEDTPAIDKKEVEREASNEKSKPKLSLEIFSLDSDEEDNASASAEKKKPTPESDQTRESNKCINISCTSTGKAYYPADTTAILYYDAAKRKKALICETCAETVVKRSERLITGIKDLTPLLELDTGKSCSDLVEISDSESEDEAESSDEPRVTLGETGASFLEANLAKMINETWSKFCLDSRLNEAQDDLNKEMEKLEAESKEIDAMLTECQVATDKLRNDLYATFEQRRRETGAITIYDTPVTKYTCMEYLHTETKLDSAPETRAKRRMSSATETPAKRPAIPLGYAPLDSDTAHAQDNKASVPTVENTKADDDKDISVLKVSAEAAPSDLPPQGELVRPPIRPGSVLFAMRNAFGCWVKARVLDITGKTNVPGTTQSFTVCRIKYEHKVKGSTKLAPARCLAYSEPATVRLTIGTRIIALFKDSQNPLKKDAFYSGIIAEVPNPVNNYRYLVFFDDGYAQYVHHRDTRVVCECSHLVWEEVHPFSREFVREYLMAYPERPMVRLHAGQSLKTEWNGKWWSSRVVQVDASLVQVHFEEDARAEWIYRGSTRLAPLFLELQAAERHRARPMPRTKAQPRINMPYVEYTRSDEQNKSEQPPPAPAPPSEKEIRQRAVAKKSTALPPAPSIPHPSAESVTSRVVYYTPKNAVKPYKMVSHTCGPNCKRKDVLALKDLRTYNPLAKPLLSGWERQIVRFKGHKEVMYRAPCGRRLRSMRELHRYLRLTQSDMAVDLFDFTPHTHCLAEFVLNKCLVGKKDLSHGKENVPVPCVNYYDESLPEFCSYNTERTPTAGVPLNLDPEFLCGCDCTDDCEDKSKCACWQMTLEGARTIGLDGPNVGYKYKRLPEPLPSGIYECNSRCKCKHTCLNRVAQHPLQLKLQVFKTLNRGWGIRALNDVPKGSFLCVYAGNLLTDATANMDGLNEGDEYLAELDYIEVVEQMKEGYEEDIPEADKRMDKKTTAKASEESEMSSDEDEDETPSKDEQEDGDFCPGFIETGVSEFSKRLRKREKSKKKEEREGEKKDKDKKEKEKGDKGDEDFITISDDEEVREPSRFMAQAGMGNEFISKYRSVRSYFGKDEACYIMDAKVQGNIGRYLNHSCQPNVFVQNVFVDTHDPRFPWVAFFALSHIKAGTELTWNYNYDVGSVPGKVLYCYCGAPNCRGRLL